MLRLEDSIHTHNQLFIHVSSMQDPFSSILLDLLHVLNVYYHISRNQNKSMHINYKFMILCDVSISLGVIILSAFIRFVSQVVNVVMINIMNRKAQVRDRDTSKTNRNGLKWKRDYKNQNHNPSSNLITRSHPMYSPQRSLKTCMPHINSPP